MHLKGILNGLAHMCWLALEGKEAITTCDLVEDFTNAIFDDLLSAEKKGRDYDQLRTECELKAKIVIANYLNWHEGWVKAGQPIAPEVEK